MYDFQNMNEDYDDELDIDVLDSDDQDLGSKGGQSTGKAKGKRGFGSMDPKKQREIASKGGQAAHRKGTAHEWNSEEAKAAGRKGGRS